MSELFVRLHLLLARRRWLVLLLLAMFVLAALWCSQRLRISEDFTDMLPLSDPAIAEHVQALSHVRQADRLFIDIQTADLHPERLLQAADRMHGALMEIPDLNELRYSFESSDVGQMLEELQAQLPTLLTSNRLHDVESKLEASALERRLAWMKQAMSQPQGLMLKNVVQIDPFGIGDAASEELRVLQLGIGDARLVAGRITSADNLHVLISAVPKFRPSELQRSAVMLAQILKAARDVEAEFPAGSVRIAVTGAHRMAMENATMLRKDTALTSVIATLAVAAFLFVSYRRRWIALAGLAPTVVGGLGALILFHLTGDSVSAVALGCGSILIGVTVDYGISVLYHSEDALPSNREQLARAVAKLAPTLIFCALTTMAAFLAMLVSPVTGHRQLGVFGLAGVALAAAFAIVVLPLFIPVGRHGCNSARVLPLTSIMQRLFAWRDRRARLVLPLLLIFSALCVWGMLRLRFEGDFSRLNGVTPDAKRDEEVIRRVWGKGLSLTTVVVTAASREEALQKNEQVFSLLHTLKEKRVVESFASIAPLLPSDQARRENLQAWTVFWSESRQQLIKDSLNLAGSKLGFRTGAFTPFLERIAAAARLSEGGNGATPALDRLLSDFWTEKEGQVSICTLVKSGDRGGFPQLREAIHKQTPGALLLNKAALSDDIIRVTRRALPVFAILVVVLNAALLYLLLGRVELVLVTLLPIGVGMFWTLGTLGLLGVPIDVANFIFSILVIGVGSDYSLFMVMAELDPLRGRPDQTASTGGAVTICAGTTLLGIGVLVLAQHPAMFSIGLSAWLGITFSLLATLFLVRPCMAYLRQRATVSARTLGRTGPGEAGSRRKQVRRLFRYQGAYVEQYVLWKTRTDPLFQAIDEVAPSQGHILDVGCGYGLVVHWLALGDHQRTFHGLDYDSEKVRVAQASARELPRIEFQEGDLLRTTWPACDVVLLCDVLHYFPRELKAQILRHAFEALHPGGTVIVREACSDASRSHAIVVWAECLAVWLRQNKTDRGLHFETAAGYSAMLTQAGFVLGRQLSKAGLGSNSMMIAKKAGSTRR